MGGRPHIVKFRINLTIIIEVNYVIIKNLMSSLSLAIKTRQSRRNVNIWVRRLSLIIQLAIIALFVRLTVVS